VKRVRPKSSPLTPDDDDDAIRGGGNNVQIALRTKDIESGTMIYQIVVQHAGTTKMEGTAPRELPHPWRDERAVFISCRPLQPLHSCMQ
jgi:hypothetical protein